MKVHATGPPATLPCLPDGPLHYQLGPKSGLYVLDPMARSFSIATTVALAFTLMGCASNEQLPAEAGALDPIAFFLGRTHGDAQLHKIFSKTVRVEVDGVGRRQNDTLVLDQTTQEGKDPPKQRRWVMQKIGPNRYTGTLTDAVGPVDIRVAGPRAFIRYKIKGGLTVRQQLALQRNQRTILNKLDVTKFGIRVASLQETIRKLD